jgi:conjugative transposon TraM protein
MNTVISTSHSDAAFFRDRKAMLMYPVIILPFVTVLFFMFGGGKGERYLSQESALTKAGSRGFNAEMPTAKNGTIDGREVETPGYGKAAVGQVLSSFTNTRRDSASGSLKAIPVTTQSGLATNHASSLATTADQPDVKPPADYKPARAGRRARTGSAQSPGGYYYNAPKNSAYSSASDQQLASQLRTYENARQAPVPNNNQAANQAAGSAITPGDEAQGARTANVQISDNLTATRLAEPASNTDAFNTAPTNGSRRQAERAILSGGSSYGSKKTVAWMIPVVVHEDQTFKSGNTVKLRLTREIAADGITIPANTILHAVCQSGEDRLRMTVRSLQLNGQLIPLDLDVYDMDGLAGVNMPGLSNQTSGQLQSSAVQGIQLPGAGSLINTVASSARMQASQNLRQPTVRLKAGYNLYLKAQ